MDLELTILNYLREKEFYNKVGPHVKEEMFGERGQIIFSSINELMKGCPEDGKIKMKDIGLYLSSDATFSKNDLKEFKVFRKQIRNSRVSNQGVLLEICKEFLEKNLWKDALERFMPFLTKKGVMPVDSIEEALEATMRIRESFSESKGYDYSKNTLRASVKDENPKAIETPIRGIYLFPGEVGIWGGIPKKGKTWALINTGYAALVQGKSVLHFTMEISADWAALRYDGRILGKAYRDIKPDDSKRAVKKMEMFGGSLIIEDRSELTLLEIRNYLKMKKADMVIIDYADLMTPPRKAEKRIELLSIFQGIRRIAKEFQVPIWTASQLTAKSSSKTIATMEDLEESKIGKAGTAALIFTINQDSAEREDEVARIFIAAATRGFPGKQIRKVEANFNTMTMRELGVRK